MNYGSFQSGTEQGLHRNEQPPPTQQGAFPKGKGAVIANAVTPRRLGLALTIVYTPNVARTVRASAMVIREQTYVEAAKVQGSGNFRILWKLILPGVISPLTVQASYIFSQAIISEASLSFLGAGVPAPAASWGNMLEASKAVLSKAPWTMIVPGAAVIICVLSLNLFGDGLRDFMDPRTKGGVKK